MDTFNVGDQVRVHVPFTDALPDVYTIEAIHEDGTCVIAGGIDYSPTHLSKV